MRLNELTSIFIEGSTAVEYSQIHPYRKSLRIIFKDYFTSEPMLVAVAVMNAAQYCIIAPANEILEAISMYDDKVYEDGELEEVYTQYIQPL